MNQDMKVKVRSRERKLKGGTTTAVRVERTKETGIMTKENANELMTHTMK